MSTALSNLSPEFGILKKIAQDAVIGRKFSADLVISLGGTLAAEANKLSSLSGSQKKQLVCDVVKTVLHESVEKSTAGSALVSKDDAEKLLFVVDSVLPASLDLAVAAARGKFDLKKAKKTCFSSLLLCVPFVASKLGFASQSSVIVEQLKVVAAKVDPELVKVEVEAPKESPPVVEAPKESSPVESSNPEVKSDPPASENTETPPQQNNHEATEEPHEEVKIPETDSEKV
jgi:hypothetical protein